MIYDNAQWCKHYGVARDAEGVYAGPSCARGVDIRKHVSGPRFGWMRRIPCVKSKLSECVVPCAMAEMETADVHFAELREQIKDGGAA